MTSNTNRIGRLLRSRRLRRALSFAFALWGWLMMALIATIVIYARADRAQPADVIVILGAGLEADNQPGPALYRRTEHGAALWQRGLAATIICSGGYPLNRPRSEADACAQLLREQGVPDEAILQEDQSRSTEENAYFTDEIMQAHGWHTAVLVSDGYHQLRAHWLFDRVGIENYPSPAADPPFFNLVFSVLREVVAFHWLAFKFLFNLPLTYVPVL